MSTGLWSLHLTPMAGLTCQGKVLVLVPDDDQPVGSKDYMNTVLHEGLHATDYDLHEMAVRRMAGDLTELLWSLGYRLKKRRPKRRTASQSV